MNTKIVAFGLVIVLVFNSGMSSALSKEEKIKIEADYILSCQIEDPQHPAYGVINNVYGKPTWIVPRENAMAILGLIVASEVLDSESYLEQAQLAADFLLELQNSSDGAWCNHYNCTIDSYIKVEDYAKSPTHTAEVMIAFYELGYDSNRSNAMKNGAKYLMECQKVENKGGNDDGLLGGGKDANGQYHGWRWTHDNSYAYWALKAAEDWAKEEGNISFASECADSAQEIIDGIDTSLYDSSTGIWYIAIDGEGKPQWGSNLDSLPSWIQYAPQMLDLPATGVNSTAVGEWIHNTFQQDDGSCIGYYWDKEEVIKRKYPGLAFQAALSWFDTGHASYAEVAIQWAEDSGLWNNITYGGWMDWNEPESGNTSNLSFIDTSFYAIASWNGGYDFRCDRGEVPVGTNPYSVDSDGEGLKDPEGPNPTEPKEKEAPGFEVVFVITGLLAVAYLVRRRK